MQQRNPEVSLHQRETFESACGLQPAAPPPTPRPVKLPLAEQNQLVRNKLAADQAMLLDGVKNLPVGGDVGRITVFGPTAFPVIAPTEVQTRQKGRLAGPYCVLAAGRLDKGRVAAFGHDCWLIGAESFSTAVSPQLLDNLLRWLANRLLGPAGILIDDGSASLSTSLSVVLPPPKPIG